MYFGNLCMTLHVSEIAKAANVDCVPVSAEERGVDYYNSIFKRIVDVVLVTLSLPIVLPFLAMITILLVASGNSPFYRQERVGRDGRRFQMLKFRTMVPDADKLLERHLAQDNDARVEWLAKQKLTNDPRCTRLGRALRRTSIDELPQLWNVFLGDMSLVGPRPMMPSQQALYPGHAYYNLRPGMTGSWQVSTRNESEFADRAKFDDQYARTVSARTDATILARTVSVVVRGTGC